MKDPFKYKISDFNKLKAKQGRLLIAEPFMSDPYFKRSVVLLTGFEEEGIFGFILNKKIDVKINDLIKNFPEFDAPIYMGGPVQSDTIFFIHAQGEYIEESIKISEKLYWSGNFTQLNKMIKNHEIFPNEIMFFIGYSGWETKQLEDEIKEESWIISEINLEKIDSLKENDLWKNTLKKMGPEASVLTNFPEDPSLN